MQGILSRPYMQTGGNFGSPKIDLGGCVFYAPLWRQELGIAPNGTIPSSGVYGTPVHTCTVTGAVWGSQGRIFDGTDDKIAVPDAASLDLATDLTVAVWLKPDVAGAWAGGLVKGVDASYFNNYEIYIQNDAYVFNISKGSVDRSGLSFGVGSAPINTWAFLVGTFAKPTQNVYLNGVYVTTASYNNNLVANANDLIIGWSASAGKYFDGVIGEVLIYNRALTAQEIQNNYLATKWRYQ